MKKAFMFLIFRRWALIVFPASTLPYIARKFYTRSAAVMELSRCETASANGRGAPRSTHFMLGKLY